MNLPAVRDIWVLPRGRDDPLEKSMATRSSVLACRIPWTEEPGRLQSMGSPSQTELRLSLSSESWYIGLEVQAVPSPGLEKYGDRQGREA